MGPIGLDLLTQPAIAPARNAPSKPIASLDLDMRMKCVNALIEPSALVEPNTQIELGV